MRKSGPRSLSPSAGTNFTVLTLRLRVLTVPVKPFSVLVKVPMVAIVVFLFPIGPRQSRPRWRSFDRGRSDRTRRAQRQRLTAADGFFASRCKARHARRKKVGGGRCGKTIEAKPVFGQTLSIRDREADGAYGNYLEHEKQQRHFAKDDGGTALVTKALPLNDRIFGHRFAWASARAANAS